MHKPTVLAEYERSFAAQMTRKHALGFWKGRVAIYAMLRALGVGEGDEVVMPGYTCVMAVNPAAYLKAKLSYVDIDPVTYNMDPNLLEAAITPKTKVIMAQHTYGYPADLSAIMDIANRKGLPVIEDCCLSLGSRLDGRLTGTTGVGAYFSFQWNKPYTTGIGGMAVMDDDDFAKKVERIQDEAAVPSVRQSGMLRMQYAVYRALIYPRTTMLAQNIFRALVAKGMAVGSCTAVEYTPEMPEDFFQRMSGFQAGVGLRQLRRLDRSIAHRKKMAKIYDDLLAEKGWPVAKIPDNMDPVLVRYPVRVADKSRALAEAAKKYVELGSWFECPLHPLETNMKAYGYHEGMCPIADKASREVVNMPVHPRTNEKTARRTVEFLATIGGAQKAE